MSRSKFVTPAVGLILGAVMAVVEYGRNASLGEAALVFAIVGGYTLAILLLQSRSETMSLLSGLPIDERWQAINQQALASAAQIMALVLVVAFIGVEAAGGDAMPYAWVAAVFALSYLGSILWYRWRS